ncbi:DNA-directed RNA polymerase III subunit rpc4 [Neolecta irregularis DAH-3]|uniref:DNA-directed RNA polymerase III subunit rpc4 n=1 Tax=Neolecta irregularis (strain DAH-3) TaxID=1198029 RepID=A0A1U7LUT3_NEOID|nr:DNA-directed RNA polymerase III subunit rpc4 [Neolecta irregularis DAH-3]|eukprot:OLL26404.1 DNA-directed RNA polymerase III subunit rpc4 [Neolecta irregularis DAH-3]
MSEQSSNVPVTEGRLESIMPPRTTPAPPNIGGSKMKFAPKAIPRKRREGTSLLDTNKNESDTSVPKVRPLPKPRTRPEPAPLTASGPLSMGPSGPSKGARLFPGGSGGVGGASGYSNQRLYHPSAAPIKKSENDHEEEEEEEDAVEDGIERMNLSNFGGMLADPMAPVFAERLEKPDRQAGLEIQDTACKWKKEPAQATFTETMVKHEPTDLEMTDINVCEKSRKSSKKITKERVMTVEEKEEEERIDHGMRILAAEFGDRMVTDEGIEVGGESEGKLFFFQLPPVMPAFDLLDPSIAKMEQGAVTTKSLDSGKISIPSNSKMYAWPPPDGIVGQLRVHRSGKTSIRWGGVDLQNLLLLTQTQTKRLGV